MMICEIIVTHTAWVFVWHRILDSVYLGCMVAVSDYYIQSEKVYGYIMSDMVMISEKVPQVHDILLLKLTFRQYPVIHTNYIISHCTTLQRDHNI